MKEKKTNDFAELLDEFTAFTRNYCGNARKVAPDPGLKRMVDIYEVAAVTTVDNLAVSFRQQYKDLSPDQRAELDSRMDRSGAVEMLRQANQFIGPNSGPLIAVKAATQIIPKIKKLLRENMNIEEGGWTDWGMKWLDVIIDNINALLPG